MSIIYYFKKPSQQQKPFVACSRDTCNFQQGLLHELSIEQKRQQVKIIPSNWKKEKIEISDARLQKEVDPFLPECLLVRNSDINKTTAINNSRVKELRC